MSWIAGLADSDRADLLGRMRALVEGGETPDEFALHVEVGLAKRLP